MPGRVKCGGTEEDSGGSWLPEEKKANMWPGRGNSGGSWPPAFPRSWSTEMMVSCDDIYGADEKMAWFPYPRSS